MKPNETDEQVAAAFRSWWKQWDIKETKALLSPAQQETTKQVCALAFIAGWHSAEFALVKQEDQAKEVAPGGGTGVVPP